VRRIPAEPAGPAEPEEAHIMRISKNDIPTRIDVPGATARQALGFGDPSAFSSLSAEYFSFGAGTDIAPLLAGLTDDVCQVPHWGFIASGQVVVDYSDGTAETCSSQDLFYWPAGHSVRSPEGAEIVMFSPQAEHTAVIGHILAKVGA
jgi:hypothetical protein